MRFLLDVCVSSHSLSAFLAGEGHDVLSAIDIDTTASDEHLLAYALKDDRILLTEDKDFGELAFVRKLRHGAVVRFVELTVDQQTDGMAELLEHHAAMLAEPARRRPGLLRILRAAHPYRNDTLQETQLAGPAAHPRERNPPRARTAVQDSCAHAVQDLASSILSPGNGCRAILTTDQQKTVIARSPRSMDPGPP